MDVKQHRAGSVGVVGDVNPAACHVPNQPGVHRAEQKLPALGPFTGALHMVQNPFDFGAAEIGVDDESGGFPDVRLQPFGLQLFTFLCGAAALPYNGVVNGTAGILIPDNGSLPLVSDADAVNILGRNAAFQ